MKKIIVLSIKFILFSSLLLLSIFGAYRVLRWKEINAEYLSAPDQMYATADQLIDVAFVGSSHCYCGIYPSVIWEKTGISAFDVSVSGQDKDSAYHDLIELYKTQSPKVVYVDMYALLFDEHAVESNVYRNYMALRPSVNSVRLVNAYIPEEQRRDYNLRFPIIHTRYRELQKYDFVVNPENTYGRGAYYNFAAGGSWVNPDALNNHQIGEISEKNRKWLNDLITLTAAHDTELVFIVIPFAIDYDQQSIINAVEKSVTELGYRFIDFNKKLGELDLDLHTDYVDGAHLNYIGARKLSEYLADDLSEHYTLQDHRGDKAYYQWDSDLHHYHNVLNRQALRTADNAGAYAKTLLEYEDAYTIVSLDGEFWNREELFDQLALLGMDYDDYLEGGKWLYHNGELTKLMINEFGGEFRYDLSKYDTLRVGYYDAFNGMNIMIGTTGYQTTNNLCFVTYDLYLQDKVVNRGF